MRILMIEDDEKLCEVVCYHLEREGFTVDVCHDGDDGLRWVRQQAHDLVILDRMLPTLSGTTVLEWMRADGISTPVLIVTALDAVADRVQGLNAGADDYLVKPFTLPSSPHESKLWPGGPAVGSVRVLCAWEMWSSIPGSASS